MALTATCNRRHLDSAREVPRGSRKVLQWTSVSPRLGRRTTDQRWAEHCVFVVQNVYVYTDLFPELSDGIADVTVEVTDRPREHRDLESISIAATWVTCLVEQCLSHVRIVSHAPAFLIPVRVVDVEVRDFDWPTDTADHGLVDELTINRQCQSLAHQSRLLHIIHASRVVTVVRLVRVAQPREVVRVSHDLQRIAGRRVGRLPQVAGKHHRHHAGSSRTVTNHTEAFDRWNVARADFSDVRFTVLQHHDTHALVRDRNASYFRDLCRLAPVRRQRRVLSPVATNPVREFERTRANDVVVVPVFAHLGESVLAHDART